MRPQGLALTRVISDGVLPIGADILVFATQHATLALGEKVEEFVAEHGAVVLSPITRTDREPVYSLMMGREYTWMQYVMPIEGGSDTDWAEMRRRCNLDT